MFNFDPTVKLGDLLQITAFLGVGIAAYYGVKAKIQEVAASQVLMGTKYDMRLDYIDATLEDAKIETKNSTAQDLHIAQQRREIDTLWSIVNALRFHKEQPDDKRS